MPFQYLIKKFVKLCAFQIAKSLHKTVQLYDSRLHNRIHDIVLYNILSSAKSKPLFNEQIIASIAISDIVRQCHSATSYGEDKNLNFLSEYWPFCNALSNYDMFSGGSRIVFHVLLRQYGDNDLRRH